MKDFSNKHNSVTEAMKPVRLCSTADKINADMILELLSNNHIPAYRKGIGPGAILDLYAGNNSFGEEIYVDERDASRAKELLDSTLA